MIGIPNTTCIRIYQIVSQRRRKIRETLRISIINIRSFSYCESFQHFPSPIPPAAALSLKEKRKHRLSVHIIPDKNIYYFMSADNLFPLRWHCHSPPHCPSWYYSMWLVWVSNRAIATDKNTKRYQRTRGLMMMAQRVQTWLEPRGWNSI